MEYCFAWKPNTRGFFGCSAIIDNCNGLNADCPFYKTVEENKNDIDNCYKHIAKLPEYQQECISNTYYNGQKPWNNVAHNEAIDTAITDVIGNV